MKTFVLESIEKAMNAYLQSDELSAKRLKKMAGKSIAVELLPFKITFICLFSAERVTLKIDNEHQPSTKISGTPLRLLGTMLDKNRHQFFADDVIIQGDAEFAQQVIHLFDQVEMDWEEQVARLIGDVPAVQLSKFVSGIRQFFGKAGKEFSQDINDYLHEEAAWFPAREELQEFFNDIDTIRMDTDRLLARFAELQTQLANEDAE